MPRKRWFRQRLFRGWKGNKRTRMPGVLQRKDEPFPRGRSLGRRQEIVGFDGKEHQASLPKADVLECKETLERVG